MKKWRFAWHSGRQKNKSILKRKKRDKQGNTKKAQNERNQSDSDFFFTNKLRILFSDKRISRNKIVFFGSQ